MKKQITKERIIEALKNGNYEVEQSRECNCSVDRIDGDGVVISGNDCWRAADLVIDDVSVYTDTQYDGVTDEYEIQDIIDDMDIEVSCGYGDMDADHTDDEIEAMIINYYEDRDDLKYYVHYPRNFANEYTLIVRPSSTDEDDIDGDWDERTLSEWAALASNSGDDATDIYVGFDIMD